MKKIITKTLALLLAMSMCTAAMVGCTVTKRTPITEEPVSSNDETVQLSDETEPTGDSLTVASDETAETTPETSAAANKPATTTKKQDTGSTTTEWTGIENTGTTVIPGIPEYGVAPDGCRKYPDGHIEYSDTHDPEECFK